MKTPQTESCNTAQNRFTAFGSFTSSQSVLFTKRVLGSMASRGKRTLLAGVFALWSGVVIAQTLAAPSTQPASDGVQCRMTSGDLNFGVLSLRNAPSLAGEGIMVLSCQNRSQAVQSTAISLGLSSLTVNMYAHGRMSTPMTVAFFHDPGMTQAWGEGTNGGEPLKLMLTLSAGEHRQLRLPVHALVHWPHNAPVGQYQVPVTVTVTQAAR